MSGIRSQSAVVINKGVDFASAEQRELSDPPSKKKFKGALEILWQKSEVALDDEGGVDAQLKKDREEKAKLDAMAVTKADAETAKKAAQEAVKKKKEEDSEAKKEEAMKKKESQFAAKQEETKQKEEAKKRKVDEAFQDRPD